MRKMEHKMTFPETRVNEVTKFLQFQNKTESEEISEEHSNEMKTARRKRVLIYNLNFLYILYKFFSYYILF